MKDLILVKVIKTGPENLSLKYLESVNFDILLTSDPYSIEGMKLLDTVVIHSDFFM